MDLGLKDQIAVITGGSVGIGLAVADLLAQEGVHLAICGRDGDRAAERAKEISQKHGVKAIGLKADVSKQGDIDNFIAAVDKEFGAADILINNAGTGSEETILNAPDEKWQYYWDLHVMAAVRLSRAIVPLMKKRNGGAIINNASIAAVQPPGWEPIYNTTKAALVMFSKCLSNELIPFNIRVNAINPGLVLTPDWIKTAKLLTKDSDITYQQHLDNVAKDASIKRFATAEEVAYFFVFMCSPRSSYCVGSSYYVDGGLLKVIT